MIGRSRLFEGRPGVKLWVRRGVIAAVEKAFVGLLFAVVGKGMPGNLAAGETTSVGEGRQKNGVDGAAFPEDVEHLGHTFIEKGDRANLDTDHLLSWRTLSSTRRFTEKKGRNGGGGGCRFQKISSWNGPGLLHS